MIVFPKVLLLLTRKKSSQKLEVNDGTSEVLTSHKLVSYIMING